MSYARQAVTRLTLDMGLPDVQKSISVTRGDTNRRLEVTLIDKGSPFALPPDWTAVLAGVLPGGDELYESCIVDNGRIIFDFVAAPAVSSEEGVFGVSFDVFDEGGEVVASPKLWVHVTAGVRRLRDPDTVDRLTALQEFVGQINRVNRELEAHAEQIHDAEEALGTHGERLSGLEDKITATGHITIPATEWTDTDPHDAFLQIPGDSFTNGGLLLLAPEDNETREACARARISVNLDRIADSDPPFYDYVWFLRAESGEIPDSPLHFVYFGIRTGAEDQEAVAAIIGVDAYGEGGGTGGVDSADVEEIVTRLVPGWARQEEPPADAVKSVNGKTGDVTLGASDVGARPDSWMPTAEDVKARPNTWTPSASDVGADTAGTASAFVAVHNTNENAHNDIRLLIEQHEESVNALLNSDDETLNETKEIVAYIKSNKSLIDSITGSKVNVTDIINNLTTNVTSKPLSAAQGVALKALIDALGVSKLDASKLTESVNTALAQAKASGEFDGENGDPGASVTVSNVTTSSADGGSNVVTFSDGKTLTVKNGSKGSPGATGKSAYAYAKDGGYTGTEAEFGARLARDYDTMIAQKLPINQGAANVGKILVVGTDGNLTLADMPEGGAIGDVVGVLDESNNILLSGELADGIYTLKWLKADGTYEDAGTLEVGEVEPVKTNFADPTSADWVKNARINGTGAASTDMLDNDYASNFIACQNGDVIRIENADITQEFYMCFYNAVQTKIQIAKYAAAISNSYVTNVTATATNAELTVNVADTSFMRFSLRDVADPNNVKIYVQRNGKWL